MSKGYWWQCEKCGANHSFNEITNSNSVAAFIWDELIPTNWDQNVLVKPCPKCEVGSLRITYDFPRTDRVIIQVYHIVGDVPDAGNYVPMIWETKPSSNSDNFWIDFKYIIGRSNWGLSRPPVFTYDSFRTLLLKFQERTGKSLNV